MRVFILLALLVAAVASQGHTRKDAAFEAAMNGPIKQKVMEMAQMMGMTSDMMGMWRLHSYSAMASDPNCIFAKVQCGPDDYVHVRVKKTDGGFELEGCQMDKSESDPIEHFEPNMEQHRQMMANMMQRMRQMQQMQQNAPTNMQQQTEPDDSGLSPAMMEAIMGKMGMPSNPAMMAEMKKKIMEATSALKEQFMRVAGMENRCPMFKVLHMSKAMTPDCDYLFKVQIAEDEFAHLKVKKMPEGSMPPMKLMGFERGKSMSDPIEMIPNHPMIMMMQNMMQNQQQQDQCALGEEDTLTPEEHAKAAPVLMALAKQKYPQAQVDMFLILKVRHTTAPHAGYPTGKVGIAKVQTGLNEFCHVKVGMDEEWNPTILGGQMGKSYDDPIECF